MYITILSLFPDMFASPFSLSIMKRALGQGKVSITYVNIRDFSEDSYKSVDDHPYGGGKGMVLRVDILDRALTYAKGLHPDIKPYTILLDAQGKQYKEKEAIQLSKKDHLIFICGHYEGFDERIRNLADRQISLGDFIVTGGELPAMVIIDSIVRLLPGVLADGSTTEESFTDPALLEYPQYTKPSIYKGKKVPSILLSGHHQKIEAWRKKKAATRTKRMRPDLVKTS
jgi:tRNA (guanine37-N1)-methyltransferase